MKLLFVHEQFGALAGAESNILATARELKERGHEVGILHGSLTGKGMDRWQEVFLRRIPLGSDYPAMRARAAVEAFQPDVIYLHKMADLAVIEALLASNVPRVRMVHDHELYCMRGCKFNYFTRQNCTRALSPYCVFPCNAFVARNTAGGFPLRWVSYRAKVRELELNRRFDRLVVASHFMMEELVRNQFDEEKIEIHPPVPPPAEPAICSTYGDRNLIVYSGQIVRGKGVDVLLQSLARVAESFECLIFGDGNHRGYCERLCAALGLTDRVFFKGHVPPEEIRRHYREATLAVMSSVWPEPYGAAGLEALRCGLPVVAFDVGGIREWLIDGVNGFLVPRREPAAFAMRVDLLLRDKPLARRLGEQGRRQTAEHCDFAKYIGGLENLFARVAEQTRPLQMA